MQKKPGEISSNTLSLRFMQNAAKTRQEREIEAAKAKVRTDEEWELAPEYRESWSVRQDEGQSVLYEPSYLPFLFPGLSSSDVRAATMANIEAEPDELHEEREMSGQGTGIPYKGRRKFGKHGREETEEDIPAPPLPSQEIALPRGARTISSHGRAATSAATSSKSSHRPPQHSMAPPPPKGHRQLPSGPSKTQGFMKPQIDAPQAPEDNGSRKRRKVKGDSSISHGSWDVIGDRDKINKKMKE